MSDQPTCEERIDEQMAGRLGDIAAMQRLARWQDGDTIDDAMGELLRERSAESEDESTVNDAGYRAMQQLPLGVSAQTVFRIDLSTGGPGDWFEVRCSGNAPAYKRYDCQTDRTAFVPFEIESISYHFNDWFDHAEQELHGDELATAEAFAREVVPELVDE
jgi:hypothetical protein